MCIAPLSQECSLSACSDITRATVTRAITFRIFCMHNKLRFDNSISHQLLRQHHLTSAALSVSQERLMSITSATPRTTAKDKHSIHECLCRITVKPSLFAIHQPRSKYSWRSSHKSSSSNPGPPYLSRTSLTGFNTSHMSQSLPEHTCHRHKTPLNMHLPHLYRNL